MKHSIRALCLAAAAALLLGACAPASTAPAAEETPAPAETQQTAPSEEPAEEGLSFTAGTYEGKGSGMFGEVVMSVTFSDTAITNIETVSSSETYKVTREAFNVVPQRILDAQSLAVDVVSSATFASRAILTAVEDACAQAGGDVELLKKPIEKTPGETQVYDADVVVLGAGGAGLSAAASAVQSGAKVVVFEKNEWGGGNTVASGGAWNAADPELDAKTETKAGQLATLESYLSYNPDDYGAAAETFRTVQQQIKDYLAGDTTYMFDSAEFHAIQTYMGGQRKLLDGSPIEGNFDLILTLCQNSLATRQWVQSLGDAPWIDYLAEPSGALWTRATAPDPKDPTSQVTAYVTNFENVIASNGSQILYDVPATEILTENGAIAGAAGLTADGTRVEVHAKAVILATGGFASNIAMVEEYDNYWGDFSDNIRFTTIPSTVGDGIVMAQAVGANLVGMEVVQMNKGYKTTGLHAAENGLNAIFVNKEGKRFVNEYAARDVYTKAAIAQGGEYFCIMNEQYRGDKKGIFDSFVFDTVKEMADHFGMDPAVLQKTIDDYNSYVEAGVDPEFGKTVFGGKGDAPYYISDWVPVIHHTMGGVEINADAQVLGTDGQVISGLYAAGEVTGGLHGGNRLGGNAVADAMTFGRIAGLGAAALTAAN